MTIKEKLTQEFEAAITAILGDSADKDEETLKENVSMSDLTAIACKVAFYLDLQ